MARGFSGDFAELYGSDNASLYRRSGADCKSGCLRRFILPRLSISPIVSIRFGEMYFRGIVSEFRQIVCPYAFCLISTPFLKVKTMLPSAFTVAFSTIAFQSWDVKSAMGAWAVFSAFRKFPMALRCILRL